MNKGKLLKVILPAVVVAAIAIGGGTYAYASHQRSVVNASVVKNSKEVITATGNTVSNLQNLKNLTISQIQENTKNLTNAATNLQNDLDSGHVSDVNLPIVKKDIVVAKYDANVNEFIEKVLEAKPQYENFMSVINSNQVPTTEQVTNLINSLQAIVNNSNLAEAFSLYNSNPSYFTSENKNGLEEIKSAIQDFIGKIQQAEGKEEAYDSMANSMTGNSTSTSMSANTNTNTGNSSDNGQVSESEIQAGNTKADAYPVLNQMYTDGTIQGVVANTNVTFNFSNADYSSLSPTLQGTEQYQGDTSDVFNITLTSDGSGNITINESCNGKPTGTYNLTGANGTLSGTFTNLSNNKESKATFTY